jgi:hypothetical protein
MTTPAMCPRCLGSRWVCEQHPDQPWDHDGCKSAGDPCPECSPLARVSPTKGDASCNTSSRSIAFVKAHSMLSNNDGGRIRMDLVRRHLAL